MATLSRTELGTLNEIAVLLHRLFGVHVVYRLPGLPADRDPWDFGRPWVCDCVRREPGMAARCDASEAKVCARAATRPARAVCHAGLEQLAVPVTVAGRRGHVLVSPLRGARTPPMVARIARRVGTLGYDRDIMELAVEQVPVLPAPRRRELVRTVRGLFAAWPAGGRAKAGYGMFHSPLRATGLSDAWVSFLWAGFEPRSEEPGIGGWLRHRAHDVLVFAALGPAVLTLPGGRRLEIPQGRVGLIPGGQRYRIGVGPEAGSARAAFDPFWIHFVSSVDLSGLAFRPFVPGPEGRLALEHLRLVAERRGLFEFGDEEKLKLLAWLLEMENWGAAGASRRGRPPAPRLDEAVARARRLLEERVAGRVSLPELAAATGASVFSLCRRFRAVHGLPPLAWQRRLRVRRAVSLLREGRLSVKEIAAQLGYRDLHDFGRAIRSATGRSPRGLRVPPDERNSRPL